MHSPFTPFLDRNGVVILDGGLATELEKLGQSLNSSLWSAGILLSAPDAIQKVHRLYLDAGADCIASASYQASVKGFTEWGLSTEEAAALIKTSVELACSERDRFASEHPDRIRPLVAASIGPYGAYLSDGSEYRGDYSIERNSLRAFHERRLELLADSDADLIAFETIPNAAEAAVLLELLEQTDDGRAWFSFSCKDDRTISDGTPIAECARMLAESDRVLAIGVNCTAPSLIDSLIDHIRSSAPEKEIVVYPNSGEVFDAVSKTWSGNTDPEECAVSSSRWLQRGARIIGGCCRYGPDHIEAVRNVWR